jgi:hypothetical protein
MGRRVRIANRSPPPQPEKDREKGAVRLRS